MGRGRRGAVVGLVALVAACVDKLAEPVETPQCDLSTPSLDLLDAEVDVRELLIEGQLRLAILIEGCAEPEQWWDGHVAYAWVRTSDRALACASTWEMASSRPSTSCPDCLFAFDTEPARRSVVGAHCDDLSVDSGAISLDGVGVDGEGDVLMLSLYEEWTAAGFAGATLDLDRSGDQFEVKWFYNPYYYYYYY